ncbi:uncharacterized protein LOC111010582 [Momordica charantia]|uniref:Uncharacterized protein LOC111010582 n=1 Tax=Momordica charantia TaxID=3673 RepID=A0A6J1CEU2_MOMCH|nr:uncharacterized protein LOC111010582 [Momordica charantia]
MGSQENKFSSDYLILKPEEATLLHLFLFTLPFGYRKLRNLVDCPVAKENSYTTFGNRWVIFISILLQKFLLAIANLIKYCKSMRGKFHKTCAAPKVNCKEWKIIGMEKNIKLADDDTFKYYGALTVMASNLAYQDYNSPEPSVVQTVVNGCWKMNLLGCYDFWNDFQNKATTQVFMFQNTATDPNVTVVAFRGSSEIYDWMVDLNLSWYNIEGIGKIHGGFMQALGLQKGTGWPKELANPDHDFAYYTLRQQLRDIVKSNDNARFIFTGHSLGGALAVLFATLLAFHDDATLLEKLQAVYTFGQPRVGDRRFAQFMENTIEKYGFKYYRYVYSSDLVPRVPFDFNDNLWYEHFGGCVYFNCSYNGKFLEVQPNKNYFSPIWLISKYVSAWWELIRSLMIPVIKCSSDYLEGFSNLLLRLFGLLFPGASAHMCLNYINSIRWGKCNHEKTLIPAAEHQNVEKMNISNI